MENINQIVCDRISEWDLPQDVQDVVNNTDFDVMNGLYGDIKTAEELIEFVRNSQDVWYAVQMDSDDNDWGTGSFDRDEAVKMAEKMGAKKIAIIEIGDDPVCIDEIDL